MSWFRSRALGRWAPWSAPAPGPGSACRDSPCWSAMPLFSRIRARGYLAEVRRLAWQPPPGRQVATDLVGGQPRRGDAGRDADAVVRGAADSQARLGRDPGPDPADPVQVTDRVLGQPAAPSRHARVRRAAGDARGGREVGRGEAGEFGVVALQHGLLADPPHRAADDMRAVGEM